MDNLERIDNLLKKLTTALWSFGAVLLFVISLSVCYDVITRYVFNYSNEWVMEYSGYMLVCIAFLGAPYVTHINRMTKVDLIDSVVSPRVKRIILIIVLLISLGYLAVLFRQSSSLMLKSLLRGWRSATTIRTPLWIPQLTIPVGVALMFLVTFVKLLKTIITKPEKEAPKRKLTEEEQAKLLFESALKEAGEKTTPDKDSGTSGKKEGH